MQSEELSGPYFPHTPQFLSVRKLQEMLGERLEQLDLDVVFLEDSHTGTASGHVHGSCPTTTAYVFIWLIAIEAMGQCDSEVRVEFLML